MTYSGYVQLNNDEDVDTFLKYAPNSLSRQGISTYRTPYRLGRRTPAYAHTTRSSFQGVNDDGQWPDKSYENKYLNAAPVDIFTHPENYPEFHI